MMYFLLLSSFALISLALDGDHCTGPFHTASSEQYQCWDTHGILKGVQFPVCIAERERCDSDGRCNCPWCDDQWNCPTFEECQANGGFLCANSYLPGSNQLWACIPREWACDGVWDCPSGEDESREFCNVDKCKNNHNLTYWYQCSDTGRCIDIWAVGNGETDCVNGEDEDLSVIAEVAGSIATTNEPLITTGKPDVPVPITGKPEVTTGKPEVTTGKPEVTTGKSEVPTGKPEPPTGKPEPPITGKPEETTMRPEEPIVNTLYGIDLLMDVLGVTYSQVCTRLEARFMRLERALVSVLYLNAAQVSTLCQNSTASESSESSESSEPSRRVLWHSSSSSSSSSSDDSDSSDETEESRPYSIQKVIVRLRFDKKLGYLQTLHRILRYVRNVYLNADHSHSARKEFDESMEDFNDVLGRSLSNELRKLVRVEVTRVSGNA